jgi:hypothetical protein
MKTSRLLFLLLFLFFLSCQDTDEKNPKKNKVLIDMNIYLNQNNVVVLPDLWLIASDKEGNILDKKHWQQEQTLELNGAVSATEKVNVMLFFATTYGTQTQYLMQVYSNVEPGRVWQLGKIQGNVLKGTSYINFTNVPSQPEIYGYQPGVTLNKSTNPSVGTTSSFSLIGGTWNASGVYSFYDEDKLFLSFMPPNGVPEYFETDSLKPYGNYTYNYDEVFVPFDHTLQLEGASYYSRAFVGAVKGSLFYGQGAREFPSPTIKLGYNDGFDSYFVKFHASTVGYAFDWSVLTPTPTSDKFNLPTPDISVTSNSLSDFVCKINFSGNQWTKNFESRFSQWEVVLSTATNESFDVFIYSDELSGGNILKNGLPDDIVAVYPDLNGKWNNLEHVTSGFIFNDDHQTYAQALEKRFSEDISVVWRTSYSISKL